MFVHLTLRWEMTTNNQINANRENAKRSTGPRTPAGKVKVRYNAMKHGMLAEAALLPDEDEETFRRFVAELTADLDPEGEYESMLAEEIVNLTWRLRRGSQVEAGLFVRADAAQVEESFRAEARALENAEGDRILGQLRNLSPKDEATRELALLCADHTLEVQETELARLGGAFARSGNAFTTLARYETALSRRREKLLQLLREAQARRAEAAAITPAAAATSVHAVRPPE